MNIDEERIAFHYNIGQSITQWSFVEFQLSLLVGSCFGESRFMTAMKAFYSIENFKSKLQYTEAALRESRLQDFGEPHWKSLRRKLEKASFKRNKLAHGRELEDRSQRPGRRLMLLPRFLPEKKGGSDYSGAVYVRDIAGFRKTFYNSGMSILFLNGGLSVGKISENNPHLIDETPPALKELGQEIRSAFKASSS